MRSGSPPPERRACGIRSSAPPRSSGRAARTSDVGSCRRRVSAPATGYRSVVPRRRVPLFGAAEGLVAIRHD
jgi:hypothetical protein